MKFLKEPILTMGAALALAMGLAATPAAGQAVDTEDESYEGVESSLPVKPEGPEEPFDNDAVTDAQNDASQRIPDTDEMPLDTPREEAVEEYNEAAAEYNQAHKKAQRVEGLYPQIDAEPSPEAEAVMDEAEVELESEVDVD